MQKTLVQSLVWEDLPEKEVATRSSILAWEITWTEESGGLQFMESQRVGQNLATKQQQQHSILHNRKMGRGQEKSGDKHLGVLSEQC